MGRGYKPLPYWATAKPDGIEKRFIQIGVSLLLDEKVKELSDSGFRLYAAMMMESGGKKDFTFTKRTGLKYGFAESTLRRRIKELEDQGFVEVDHAGATRQPNRFTFSRNWKSPCG